MQGLCLMTSEFYKEPAQVIRLWVHECERVLSDRLINQADLDKFADMRVKATRKYFAEIPEVTCVPPTD
jgi:dynein heavy chain